MKVYHLPFLAVAIAAGGVCGYLLFRHVYLPATGGLGISFEGPLQAPYLMAGQAINLLVLIAFVAGGILAGAALVRAFTDPQGGR